MKHYRDVSEYCQGLILSKSAANKGTLMYNTLSESGKARMLPLFKTPEHLSEGMERGNQALMKKYKILEYGSESPTMIEGNIYIPKTSEELSAFRDQIGLQGIGVDTNKLRQAMPYMKRHEINEALELRRKRPELAKGHAMSLVGHHMNFGVVGKDNNMIVQHPHTPASRLLKALRGSSGEGGLLDAILKQDLFGKKPYSKKNIDTLRKANPVNYPHLSVPYEDSHIERKALLAINLPYWEKSNSPKALQDIKDFVNSPALSFWDPIKYAPEGSPLREAVVNKRMDTKALNSRAQNKI